LPDWPKIAKLSAVDQPPKEKAADRAFTLAEAAVSAVPIVGGPLAVVLEAIGGPVRRRQEHWLREIASSISELQGQVELLSKPLSENEAFADAVLHATQISECRVEPGYGWVVNQEVAKRV
jgi:hypothetical protein